MSTTAAITVLRPRADVERLWRDPPYRTGTTEMPVRFVDAPGDRGTEIYVDAGSGPPGGAAGKALQKLLGRDPRSKAKDDLRRFKQRLETGVIARSDAVPEGELLKRKLKQRPAQPLTPDELEKAGV